MEVSKLYGRGIAFPPRIGSNGRWAWSQGEDNIRESIQVILLTEVGERVMLDAFGGDLRRFLFEPNTTATRRMIETRVSEALRLWEPRIRVGSVRADPDPGDEQQVIVTIEYKLVATQASEQLSLSLNLGG